MSDLNNDFEKRFTNAWFSAGWIEAESISRSEKASRKDLTVLQTELDELEERMENIELNQLRLSNLAKMYGN